MIKQFQQPKLTQITQLPLSLCSQHNLPFIQYCSHQLCTAKTRLCSKCKQSHKEHPKFFTQQKQVLSDLTTGLKKCIDRIAEFQERTKELSKLMAYAQNKSKQEYQNMECHIIEEMKKDKTVIQKKVLKMEEIHKKIEEKQRIKVYFAKLQQNNLLQLKIKLSSQQGMRNLKEKNLKLCQTMQKSNFEEIQKAYTQFFELRKQFEQELKNCSTFKIGQIIAMKNSKKQMQIKNSTKIIQQGNKQNPNKIVKKQEKKQKAKPKTTQNFGQGIINGILNFFNV